MYKKYCVQEGTTIFIFFELMEKAKREMNVKFKNETPYKKHFALFRPFLPIWLQILEKTQIKGE